MVNVTDHFIKNSYYYYCV